MPLAKIPFLLCTFAAEDALPIAARLIQRNTTHRRFRFFP